MKEMKELLTIQSDDLWKAERKIHFAEKEIRIFVNAVKHLEEMGENRVSTDYMKSALLSVRQELQR